jgi:hypothetical protein
MGTGRRPGVRARLAAPIAALLLCSCDPSGWLDNLHARVTVEVGPAQPPAAPAPAPVASTPAIEPRVVDTSGPPRLMLQDRRYAGGRPLAWWSARLARLRAQGPEDLYRLTLTRAMLCGLAVEERPGGEVAVTEGAPAPEARP